MDLKVAFTAVDFVPDVEATLECAARLAARLRIGHAPSSFARTAIEYWHGFVPLPQANVEMTTPSQLEQHGFRHIHGNWYRSENGPLEQNPYYRYRLRQLEAGQTSVPAQLEANGIHLGVHELMYTINLRLISLHLEDQKTVIGPFVGDLFETSDSWLPFHELEERTTVGRPQREGCVLGLGILEGIVKARAETINEEKKNQSILQTQKTREKLMTKDNRHV